ncbi:MAG: hypothetical protein HQ596_00580 [Candidatus Saganbacteria bacterium]|nr:hypothetical protein [Candidatus Saganbacteria bacterium]
MQTNECSVIQELPDPINLTLEDERKKIDELGKRIASQKHLHYEGYIAYTDTPYSIREAKTTLFFD